MTTLTQVCEAHKAAQDALAAVDFDADAAAVAKAAASALSAVHLFQALARRYEEGL